MDNSYATSQSAISSSETSSNEFSNREISSNQTKQNLKQETTTASTSSSTSSSASLTNEGKARGSSNRAAGRRSSVGYNTIELKFQNDDLCGQVLLRLVARGSAIVTELLRLHHLIPHEFLTVDLSGLDRNNRAHLTKRDKKFMFLPDFEYFRFPEEFDIPLGAQMSDADEVYEDENDIFQQNHFILYERFYYLFASICKYWQDYNEFIKDLKIGNFIEHTVESLLNNIEGKQLLSESLYLFGCMLLLLESRIPGIARERLVVAYVRAKGYGAAINLEYIDVVKILCQSLSSTNRMLFVSRQAQGMNVSDAQTPPPGNKMEELFGRFPIDKEVASLILGRLQSDDIYLQSRAYPSPEHRYVALANQSCLVYVILYFLPDVLRSRRSIMREIVDKHFSENWIVPYFMGSLADLEQEWQFYPAAYDALKNSLDIKNIEDVQKRNFEDIVSVQLELDRYLAHGIMNKLFVMNNATLLLNCVRKANVNLRWILLHRKTTNRNLQKIILSGMLPSAYRTAENANTNFNVIEPSRIVQLLLSTSQLEYLLKQILTKLLKTKHETWEGCKLKSVERMQELARYFTGEVALTRVERNDSFIEWFTQLGNEIQLLSYQDNPTLTGRKVQNIINALEEVEQFHEIDTNLQMKQFLMESRGLLRKMILAVGIREELVSTLEIVSDFSYGWELMGEYLPIMRDMVKNNPQKVVLMRSVFLKLASILDVPLVRLSQASSPDIVSVAEYYSGELVDFVRRVLEIIPLSIFEKLSQIVELQHSRLLPIPSKIEITALAQFAQLDLRHELATRIHQISVFTEGVLAMQTTLLGVFEIQPRQILEDGIRKELVRRISDTMDDVLMQLNENFIPANVMEYQFEVCMDNLDRILTAFKKSFVYIQDYIGMHGLRVWNEEYERIIRFNIEKECNKFAKKKIIESNSKWQSRNIPIPSNAIFMERILSALFMITDPRKRKYMPDIAAWCDHKERRLKVGVRLFGKLRRAIGVIGLNGIDHIISQRLCSQLQYASIQLNQFAQEGVMSLLKKSYQCDLVPMLEQLEGTLFTRLNASVNPRSAVESISKKVNGFHFDLVDVILEIGQSQLLRHRISDELNLASKADAALLTSSLLLLDSSLCREIQTRSMNGNLSITEEDANGINKITQYLEATGLSRPLSKIYLSKPYVERLGFDHLALFLFFIVADVIVIRSYNTKRRKADISALAAGVTTILKQFHLTNTHLFMRYLGKLVICLGVQCGQVVLMVNQHEQVQQSCGIYPQIPINDYEKLAKTLVDETRTLLRFIQYFAQYSDIDEEMAEIPEYFKVGIYESERKI